VSARHQFRGALRPQVAGVRLRDGFEKTDFQPGTLKGAHQPEAVGSQTHTKVCGGNIERLHSGISLEQYKGRGEQSPVDRKSRALSICSVSTGRKIIVIQRLRTPATAKALSCFLLALRWIKNPCT